MKYTTSKKVNNNEVITAEIRLDDDCNNGHIEFSITGEIKENHKNQNRKTTT